MSARLEIGTPTRPTSPSASRRVRVVAHLGRQVEGDRQPGLALLEQVAEALVGLLGGREAGVLAHRPEPAAVHRRLDAAGERVLAGAPEVAVLVEAGDVGRRCRGRGSRCPRGLERVAPLGAPPQGLGPEGLPPALAGRIGRSPPAGPAGRVGSLEDQQQVARPRRSGRRRRRPARRCRPAARGARSASSSPRPRGAAGRPSTASPAATDDGDTTAPG